MIYVSKCHKAELEIRYELRFYDDKPLWNSGTYCVKCGNLIKSRNDLEAVRDE